jgi:Domain of unknown function (DUF4351)
MYEYYEQLRRRHRKPVLPIALYLRVGLDGIGVDVYEEFVWDHRTIRFEFLYVGLPALDAENYVHGDHWLGLALAGLMRSAAERKVPLVAEGLKRLLEYPGNDWQRFLLGDCLIAYAARDRRPELDDLLAKEPYREVRPMIQTYFDDGLAKGREEGRAEGREEGARLTQRAILRRQLEAQFGPLSPAVVQRFEGLPPMRLDELTDAILKAHSLGDLGLE